MLTFVESLYVLIAIVLTVAYSYQVFYAFYGFVRKGRPLSPDTGRYHRYAVVIAARNEEQVIGQLLRSLKAQDYPPELLDLYVIADNCTDRTAEAAAREGAVVYKRFNRRQVGKGYAMDYFFRRLQAEGYGDAYAGYFVFDADNLVDPAFVREMNKVFDTGNYQAITCYRNSKNFASNWISAGYSLWFLREARFLNFPRMLLGTSCAISGTGFLVSAQAIRESGGWPYHLMTEDIQFSVHCAVEGWRIGYCDKAVIYDEQPTSFRQSWDQRMRWSKGFYQVDRDYGLALAKGCLTRRSGRFAFYDMLMTVAPGMLLTLILVLVNGGAAAACLTQPPDVAAAVLEECLGFLGTVVVNFYLGLLLYGAATLVSEWDQIQAKSTVKVLYLFTFPLFMFTYIPISLAALVRRVEWKPIRHNAAGLEVNRSA